MADDLKQKMIGTMAWTSVDRFGQQAIQLVISILLARLLTPSEFTLIALVMIFVTLSNTLVDGGFGQALVRKLNANQLDFSSVFFFNVVVSVLLYVFLYFSAPAIANFYDLPELINVSRVVFISILINSLYLIPNVKLIRKLDFKNSTKVNIASLILSGAIGIQLAFLNYGVWSLVAQQVSFQFFRVVFINFVVKWKPQLRFSLQVIKNFWSYGVNLLWTGILNNIFNYIYILVLGKFFQKQEVGLYYQANKLNEASNYSFQVILGNTYTVFVKIQNDTERFVRVYRELTRKSAIVIFPLLFFLIVTAKPLIFTLLSAKWLPSVSYFQMLCIASLFNPFYSLLIAALNARGKSNTTLKIELSKKILIVISVFICINYGIIPLLIGFAVANWISYFYSIIELKKELGHYWKNQLKDIFPSVAIGVFIAGVAWLLSYYIHNLHALFVLQLIIGLVSYILLVRLFYKDIFFSVLQLIGSILQKMKKS